METLDKHFRDLTRGIFAAHGFGDRDVLSNWADIVGPGLSAVSRPDRIRRDRGRRVLVVKAAPGRGLDIDYAAPRIIERLNAFLGHGAVSDLQVVQAADWPRQERQPLAAAESPCGGEIAAITDEGLQTALRRLGRGVAARTSPQRR